MEMETVEAARLIAAGLCMGLGAIGAAIGEGQIGRSALEAMARNPQMADKITTNMFIAMAITESTAIYAFLFTILILFVV